MRVLRARIHEAEREVPTGALEAALTLVETLSNEGKLPAVEAAELRALVDYWGPYTPRARR